MGFAGQAGLARAGASPLAKGGTHERLFIELQSEDLSTEENTFTCSTTQEAIDALSAPPETQLVSGLWLTFGTYSLKHGSFIDSYDLEVYGRQYYVADQAGRHSCIEASFEQPPAGTSCTYCETLEELIAYLGQHNKSDLPARLPHASTAFELHGRPVKGWNFTVLAAKEPETTQQDQPPASFSL